MFGPIFFAGVIFAVSLERSSEPSHALGVNIAGAMAGGLDDREFPPVKCPVLIIHGLKDPYLLPGALNDTWKWVENDLTLVTIPKAGHFVHRDAPEHVTRTMVQWLTAETNTMPKVEISPTEKK